MKQLFCLVFLFFFFENISLSQSNIFKERNKAFEDSFQYDTDEYTLTENQSWAKSSKSQTFENQGTYHSNYISIDEDSTFSFLSIYEPGGYLSVGNWKKLNDSMYSLKWNFSNTIEVCKDKGIYKKYYQYDYPTPLKISNWVFIYRNSQLLPVKKRRLNKSTKMAYKSGFLSLKEVY